MATAALRRPREHLTTPDAPRPHTAFVLSGGASLGALQVGMLEAVYEHDIVPDMLVGSSAGALNAAFIASRPQTTATAKGARPHLAQPSARGHLPRQHQRGRRWPVRPARPPRPRSRAAPPRPAVHRVRRPRRRPDSAKSGRIRSSRGARALPVRGPAVDSVVATSSIPGVFPPVALGHRRLIDGGVVNNTHMSHAVELGAERIYVLPTQDPLHRQLDRAPKSALDPAIYGVRLLVDSRLEADIVRYSPQAELIVLPAPNAPGGVQPTSFEYSTQLIVDARVAARRALMRQDVGRQLRVAK